MPFLNYLHYNYTPIGIKKHGVLENGHKVSETPSTALLVNSEHAVPVPVT